MQGFQSTVTVYVLLFHCSITRNTQNVCCVLLTHVSYFENSNRMLIFFWLAWRYYSDPCNWLRWKTQERSAVAEHKSGGRRSSRTFVSFIIVWSSDDPAWQRAPRPRSPGTWLCWALQNISARRVRRRSGYVSTVCRRCFSSSRPRGSRPGLTCSWARCCTATQRTASWPRPTWRKRWAAAAVSDPRWSRCFCPLWDAFHC